MTRYCHPKLLLCVRLLALAVLTACASPAIAQDQASSPTAETPTTAAATTVVTRHTLQLPGRTLTFTATVGAIPHTAPDGRVLAETGYVAYTLDRPDAGRRPVTFAVNGGPGASSAWLHLGAMGPWRLPLESGPRPGPNTSPADVPETLPSRTLPNAETWLDFTDLVFIDPVGTGYSRVIVPGTGETSRAPDRGKRERSHRIEFTTADQLWSVSGDIQALSDVIEQWLDDHGRIGDPLALVGESYGGFRAPRIARSLARSSIDVRALLIVSPVLDFEARRYRLGTRLYAHLLPSLAANTLEANGEVPTRTALAEAETYASGAYLLDLLRGPRDKAAVARMSTRVAALTGVSAETVTERSGRLGAISYIRAFHEPQSRIASIYDASVTAPSQGGSRSRRYFDPFLSVFSKPLEAATVALYRDKLNYKTERAYVLQNTDVLRGWKWSNSPNPPEALSALHRVLERNKSVRVLVTHGYSDLVTPYFSSVLHLRQLPDFETPERLGLEVYPGGHMFYSRDGSRSAFRRHAEMLVANPQIPAP